jgi:hypothetical protein
MYEYFKPCDKSEKPRFYDDIPVAGVSLRKRPVAQEVVAPGRTSRCPLGNVPRHVLLIT